MIFFCSHNFHIVVYFYQTNNSSQNGESKSPETSSSWLRLNDLTIESVEKYNSMSNRQPITFDMYKTKAVKQVGNTPVCKLPVMFFWVRKTTTLVLDKNTGKFSSTSNYFSTTFKPFPCHVDGYSTFVSLYFFFFLIFI